MKGQKVRLEFEERGEPERGRYDRLLVYTFVDGENLNVELVRRGWSKYVTEYGMPERCHAEFVAAQRVARRGERGIWGE